MSRRTNCRGRLRPSTCVQGPPVRAQCNTCQRRDFDGTQRPVDDPNVQSGSSSIGCPLEPCSIERLDEGRRFSRNLPQRLHRKNTFTSTWCVNFARAIARAIRSCRNIGPRRRSRPRRGTARAAALIARSHRKDGRARTLAGREAVRLVVVVVLTWSLTVRVEARISAHCWTIPLWTPAQHHSGVQCITWATKKPIDETQRRIISTTFQIVKNHWST